MSRAQEYVPSKIRVRTHNGLRFRRTQVREYACLSRSGTLKKEIESSLRFFVDVKHPFLNNINKNKKNKNRNIKKEPKNQVEKSEPIKSITWYG